MCVCVCVCVVCVSECVCACVCVSLCDEGVSRPLERTRLLITSLLSTRPCVF